MRELWYFVRWLFLFLIGKEGIGCCPNPRPSPRGRRK